MLTLKKTEQSSKNQAAVLLNPSSFDFFSASQRRYLLSKVENSEEDFYGAIVGDDSLFFVAIARQKDLSLVDWQEKLRQAGAKICAMLNAEKIAAATLQSTENAENTLAFLEGMYLKNYQFLHYRKEAKKLANSLQTIELSDSQIAQSDLDRLMVVCQATYQARDLGNYPPYVLNAQKFVEFAKDMASDTAIEIEVFDKQRIEQEQMVGLLNVNRGSALPPLFLKMEYKPQHPRNDKPVVLVGKGVLFDTGGYSLKPSDKMQHMKVDMAGGAAMVATVCAAAKQNIDIHIITLVPLCENRVNENAYTVDEVIEYPNGLRVEVQNTDAEGRLVVADALLYAQKLNPWFVIDCATLTGASHAITGEHGISYNAKNFPYQAQLQEAGYLTHERLIELPLWLEYGEMLKSHIADIRNIGGPIAGATTAAKFLEHFTAYPWVHLDIAGMSWIESSNGYQHAGASGVGVRLLSKFLEKLS